MSIFNTIKNIYFLGIGGIGMSALAQYFVLEGKHVAGYDKTPSNLTNRLEKLGVVMNYEDDEEAIPNNFQKSEKNLVVYTPAIPDDLKLFAYFKNNRFPIKKRAEVLGEISKEIPTLAVAGTHGKTTTSAILAHLLKESGYRITAFLGGVLENYHSNFIGEGKEGCVVEADEYDRSFLQLHPNYAAIMSMDVDHLDIYDGEKDLIQSFRQFADKVTNKRNLFYQKGLNFLGQSIGFDKEADFAVTQIAISNGAYRFDLKAKHKQYRGFELCLPGRHNLMNAATALAMALHFGAPVDRLKIALRNFKGVERRFSYHYKTNELVLIEDYAHHPKELQAVHQAIREMHSKQRVTAVFQPHLYSRTRDFAHDFAKSLALFDKVYLLPIFPAREKPIPGVDSAYLLELIKHDNKKLIRKEELPNIVIENTPGVVVLLGAGDIGNEVECIKNKLEQHAY